MELPNPGFWKCVHSCQFALRCPTYSYPSAPSGIVQSHMGYQNHQPGSSMGGPSVSHRTAGPSNTRFRVTSQASNAAYSTPTLHSFQPNDLRGAPISNQSRYTSQTSGVQVSQGAQPYYHGVPFASWSTNHYPTQFQYSSNQHYASNTSTSSLSGALGQPQQSIATPQQRSQSTNSSMAAAQSTTANSRVSVSH